MIMDTQDFWLTLKKEAHEVAEKEPLLASFVHSCVLNHHNFESALSFILSNKIADEVMPTMAVREIFDKAYILHPHIVEAAMADIKAVYQRDPAVKSYLTVLIHFKGFQAIQVHRLAHILWQDNRHDLALFFQRPF